MRLRIGLVSLLLVLMSGCAPHDRVPPAAMAPTLAGDAEHPAVAQGWVDTKLYFGLGPADHPEQGISETEWRAFLDREVTPRFPSGLSVADIYGQWQAKGQQQVERLRTKMLIVLYVDSAENRGKVDAIRAAWKRKTGDQSVLRVTEPADVSF
ncbi:MAG TPA: DUF3574 domain-containing protein [Candidatus Angelobacter sp.]|jgi:hypothetical protein|nr:DUF3574 domain-containing protein [Candidatus Angelobacter sp.]